jgi:hypothetical protein
MGEAESGTAGGSTGTGSGNADTIRLQLTVWQQNL